MSIVQIEVQRKAGCWHIKGVTYYGKNKKCPLPVPMVEFESRRAAITWMKQQALGLIRSKGLVSPDKGLSWQIVSWRPDVTFRPVK